MSWVPCSMCHKTDGVQLGYFYGTTFRGDAKVGWRARLCPVCFDAALGDFFAAADRRDEGADWLAPEQRA